MTQEELLKKYPLRQPLPVVFTPEQWASLSDEWLRYIEIMDSKGHFEWETEHDEFSAPEPSGEPPRN